MRLREIIIREKLYFFLLMFIILANISFHCLDKVFPKAPFIGVFHDKGICEKEEPCPAGNTIRALSLDPFVYMGFLMLSSVFLFFILLGIVIAGLFLCEKIREKEPIILTQVVEKVHWGLPEVCKVIIIFFFVGSVMSLFLAGGSIFLPRFVLGRNIQLMAIATILDITAVAAVFYFALKKKPDMALLGLTVKNFLLNIKYGVMAYIGLVPIFFTVTITTALIFKVFNIPVEPQDVVEMLSKEESVPSLIYMAFFTSLFGPVMEEIFFRGFVYGALKNKTGVFWGIIFSAVFFSFVHANTASFMPILCLGLLLAYIYEKTGSLVSSITAHIMHNSAMLIILLFLKKIAEYS